MADSMSTRRLSDLWRAVVRHRKKSFATFVLVVITAGAAAIFAPKIYHSEGLLLVRLGRENSTLDPTVTMGQDPVVTNPISREGELNSVIEILKSRAVAEKVVDLLGPEFILGQSAQAADAASRPDRLTQFAEQLRGAWARTKEAIRRLGGTSEPADHDRAITALIAGYTAGSAGKSDLIQIDCKGPSPQWTQKIVATLMEVYQSEHIRLNRPDRSVEFFSEQTERAGQDWWRSKRPCAI